jgi:hypothetical protein
MNRNDYEAVWKRQPLPIGADADLADLKATFETKRRKLAATLMVRDYAEASAGVLGCIAFGFIWRQVGSSGWPIGIAIVLALGVSAVFVRERIRSRRLQLGKDAPLLAKVEADLALLVRQRRMVHTIWRWYLGPILAAVLICHFTLTTVNSETWEPQRDPVIAAGFVAFYLFCSCFAWLINRRACRKQLDPRIEELEKLRRELRENE